LAPTGVTGKQVAVLLQCVSDRLRPEIAVGAVELLEAAGAIVEIPPEQHCCGLPAFDGGDWRNARLMAEQTIAVFEDYDLIVTPAPSCVVMAHEYRKLFEDSPDWLQRADRVAAKTQDLISCFLGPARLPAASLATGEPAKVCIDRFCQSTNVLDLGHNTERLVRHLTDAEVMPLAESETCCGFGGSTSLVAPETAKQILKRKLDWIAGSGAPVLLSDNPGCVLHLEAGVAAAGLQLRVLHPAEFLADRLRQVREVD
jgi:Fe-S oxidoreductase